MAKLSLDNTKIAFSWLQINELKRYRLLFYSLSLPLISTLGNWILRQAFKMGLPIHGVVKQLLFKQFCGGESYEDCEKVIERLSKFNVKTVVDFAVESQNREESYRQVFEELLRVIDLAGNNPYIPFSVFKPTALCDPAVLQKKAKHIALNAHEEEVWRLFCERFRTLARHSKEAATPLLVDAEESWLQGPVDRLCLDLMGELNATHESVTVFNTLQMYRQDSLGRLKEWHQKAKAGSFRIGIKLVRGAYLEKENDTANQKNMLSPLQLDKSATDADFDAALFYCLEHIQDFALFIGTHNEASIRKAVQKIEEEGIPINHPELWFSQLYGMGDYLSFNLAYHGYNVAKYLPYGPVESAMPYLLRRAQENSSVKGQANRDLVFIEKEIKRRKKLQFQQFQLKSE